MHFHSNDELTVRLNQTVWNHSRTTGGKGWHKYSSKSNHLESTSEITSADYGVQYNKL